MPSSLIFKDAEKARDAICAEDQKKIRQLYSDWADEVGKRAEYYHSKETASSYWQEQQMLELQRQLTEQSKVIANQIYTGTKESMYTVADSVVGCNAKYLSELGFPSEGLNAAFTSVPTQVVNNLVTGQIYEGGWNLSSAIWSDNEQTLHDIYQIVAQGRAMNMSAYDVSKMLEQYVNPNKAKQWNLTMSDGRRIYKRSVDYNAQRLTRTLTQHAYQQGVIQCAKDNPFIQAIVWRANGSRTCELCLDRDGKEYKWDEVPMDHPNGMCTMEPKINMDKTLDQLVNWFSDDDGEYPEIDRFASKFGYVPGVSQMTAEQQKWINAAGYTNGQMPKNFTEFAHKLSFNQQDELLKAAGGSWDDPHPFQVMEKYYNENIAKAGGQVAVKSGVGQTVGVESLGTSSGKTFNYWYTKLNSEQKALAQQLKSQSGLTWQQWYEQNIYKAKGKATQAAAQQAMATAPAKSIPIEPITVNPNGRTIAKMGKAEIQAAFATQTESEMLSMEARAFAQMTNEQSAGISRYTGSAYTSMNDYLRQRATGVSHEAALKHSGMSTQTYNQMLQAQQGLAAASTERDLVLRRGTDLGDIAGLLPGDFHTNKLELEGMSVDELNQRLSNTVGTYAGFTSTSSQWDRGFQGEVEIIFNAPAGTQASSVMSVSQYGTSEGETLLNSGTTVRIDRVEKSDGHKASAIRIFMDVIGVKPIK